MASPILIHVIGTMALIAVLFATILYTSIRTNTLIYENEKKTLERIARSIAYQILLAIMVKSDNSVLLNYPVEALYGRAYDVIIASGGRIRERYSFISGLSDKYIYVVAVDPVSRAYAYTVLVENTSSTPILIVESREGRSCSWSGVMLFSSGAIVYVKKTEASNQILLSCELKGVKTG